MLVHHRVGLIEVRKFLTRLNSKEVVNRAKTLFSLVDMHRQSSIGFEEFEQLYSSAIYVKTVGGVWKGKWVRPSYVEDEWVGIEGEWVGLGEEWVGLGWNAVAVDIHTCTEVLVNTREK